MLNSVNHGKSARLISNGVVKMSWCVRMGSILCKLAGLIPLALMVTAIFLDDASPATIYRIGKPFSPVERDSLQDIGLDFKEISWLNYESVENLDVDSLKAADAGSIQPKFIREGESIAATALDRGGWIAYGTQGNESLGNNEAYGIEGNIANNMIDGDPTTAFVWLEPPTGKVKYGARCHNAQHRIVINLGGIFVVDKVRFYTRQGISPEGEEYETNFIEDYELGTSLGRPQDFIETHLCRGTGYIPSFRQFAKYTHPGSRGQSGFPSGSSGHHQDVENLFSEVIIPLDPPEELSYVALLIYTPNLKTIEIAEFEVLGQGFVDEASYIADIIELDDIGSFGEITWSGSSDPKAEVKIRSRSGTDRHPDVYWRITPEQRTPVVLPSTNRKGEDLSPEEYKSEYDKLPGSVRGPVTYDTENWSFWSAPYNFESPGEVIASPGPRKFFQIGVDFISEGSDGSRIEYLQFKASVPPAAREIVGEIFPPEVEIGKITHKFSYFVTAWMAAVDKGFDSLEITTPYGVTSVDSLRVDGINQDGFTRMIKEDGSGFEVTLPSKLDRRDSGVIVEVVFQAPVLRERGTFFDGRVFDSAKPHEVRQKINPGNVADEIESDVLTVITSLAESILSSPEVSPNPFTPNGDGVNDLLNISYTILRLTAPVPVSIDIYDLSGVFIKTVYSGNDSVGQYTRHWDGGDNKDNLVPPGIYVYRISVEAQEEEETATGTISVVY